MLFDKKKVDELIKSLNEFTATVNRIDTKKYSVKLESQILEKTQNNIQANCNTITFFNTGNDNITVYDVPLRPSEKVTFDTGDIYALDKTVYNVVMPDNGRCLVIRKHVYYD